MAKTAPKTAPKTTAPKTAGTKTKPSPRAASPAAETSAGSTKTKASPKLPASLVNALPASAQIMKHMQAIEALLPEMAHQMHGARNGGAIALARAYVVLHRMDARIDEIFKPFNAVVKEYKEVIIPEAFEVEGLSSAPLAEGFRVGVSARTLASLKTDRKPECYAWLRANYPDVVQETVNASTLSKLAKEMLEENRELPDELFNVALVPTTSVTQTG